MSANDTQIGGKHYKADGIEPWDYVAANNLGYFEGNIVKYVSRWKDKGGVDDLRKAKHYIEKLIELETQVKDESKTIHGFIPWAGGEQPLDNDVKVEVLLSDSHQSGTQTLFAGHVDWSWSHLVDAVRVTGYRVIK
jgi:hypothetical protein